MNISNDAFANAIAASLSGGEGFSSPSPDPVADLLSGNLNLPGGAPAFVRINGVRFTPEFNTDVKRAIFVIDRGWIFAGDFQRVGDRIKISRVVWIFRWEDCGFSSIVEDANRADLRPFRDIELPKACEIFSIPVADDWGIERAYGNTELYADVTHESRAVVVVDRGWIFAGDIQRLNVSGTDFIHLTRANWIYRWEGCGFSKVIDDHTNAELQPIKDIHIPASSEIFTVHVPADWGADRTFAAGATA